MTRKEQKEERRKAILMTALELFVKRGYYETKITDIAAAVPMSTGLMFHYFESKEELLTELIRMGAEYSGRMPDMPQVSQDILLAGFLKSIFEYADKAPWVFNMFVLMGRARRIGMPEEVRQAAQSVRQVENTAELVKAGQKAGVFRDGDPVLLATLFWTSVQGIMEEMAYDPDLKAPDPEWIVAMLRK